MKKTVAALLSVLALTSSALADREPREGDVVLREFAFRTGERLPELRLHYTTLGTLKRDETGRALNAVLLLHGTTGIGKNFLQPSISDVLFGPGQPLDAEKYFIIMPDGIGRGGSSKPSDGLRTQFPHYGYRDLVAAQHAMLADGLNIDHLRLILGTSMGGMLGWLWGETFPDYADAIMPIASQPVAVTGRNYLWRQLMVNAIRTAPDWRDGHYDRQPRQFTRILPLFAIMTSSAAGLQARGASHESARRMLETIEQDGATKFDANDYLYWFTAVDDYDPEPDLGRIKAKVLAVNFADDLLNPPELGVMERLIPQIPGADYVLIPEGPDSQGHLTLAQAKLWAPHLRRLLESPKQ